VVEAPVTHFSDGEPCTYFGTDARRLRAVGWLDPKHPFATGAVSAGTLERLVTFVRDPWQPVFFKGWHRCALCPPGDDPFTRFTWQQRAVPIGVANLFIPGDGFLWAAPSMIVHYIADHGYRPPDEFLAAVEACPAMNTPAYLEAIKVHGPSWSDGAEDDSGGTTLFG
jgi:hypothetical protein